MTNYSNGKIYKIENNIDDMVYIGSTTKTYLSQRMVEHRSCYKSWKAGKSKKVMVYEMFEKHGIQNCFIVLLELVDCEIKDEILAREAFYIKTLVCVNKIIPLRTKKEYYVDNKEKMNDSNKQYRIDNKEKIKDLKKEYYNDNRDKILEILKIKCPCECGSSYGYSNRNHHEKTKKHISFLANKNIILL